MSEDRPLYEDVLDYLVYAPVGIMVGLARNASSAIAEGREKISGSVGSVTDALKSVHGTAVADGREHLEGSVGSVADAFRTVQETVFTRLSSLTDEVTNHVRDLVSSAATEANAPESNTTPEDNGLTVDAPFPGYDALGAATIIERLDGLTPLERRTVFFYESSRHNRQTVLGRIRQLDGNVDND